MSSTESSDSLLKVKNLKVFFELEHYENKGLREIFISSLGHPLQYFFKTKELFYALNDVSFELQKGSRLGVLGVNGSGKTTLCRCLAGMMTPQFGEIDTKAEIRAIFDSGTGVMPELTGRENAYLLARLFFPKSNDIETIVNESIEFSELGHFIDVPFKKYSKGMQSRLMLSLISSKTTDILILDEVFDGADMFFKTKLASRMMKFIESAGATIFVSHSIEQIREVCNQLLVLNQGKVHFFGDIEEGIKSYIDLKS